MEQNGKATDKLIAVSVYDVYTWLFRFHILYFFILCYCVCTTL